MGYTLSRYNDVRLEGSPFYLESCRDYVRIGYEGDTIEIDDEDLEDLRTAITVLIAFRSTSGSLHIPTRQQLDAWKQADDDERLTQELKHLTPEDLRRAAELLESPPK